MRRLHSNKTHNLTFASLPLVILFAACVAIGCQQPASTTAPKTTAAQDVPAKEAPKTTKKDEKPKQLVSLNGKPLTGPPPGDDVAKLEADLAAARKELGEHPNDPERIIWVGRRLGYLWRMQEAIDVYSEGIELYPENAALYRHRGHRYISIREFDKAISDLEKAAKLAGRADDVAEQDGKPNDSGTPLTTLKYNIWYHLGVAKYMTGDYFGARDAFVQDLPFCGGKDDNLVAVSYWLYITAKKMGKDQEAERYLKPITRSMKVTENFAYIRCLLLYKNAFTPQEFLNDPKAKGVDKATLRYGLSQWYLHNAKREDAIKTLEEVVAGDQWPAFGYIAAEIDLKQLR